MTEPTTNKSVERLRKQAAREEASAARANDSNAPVATVPRRTRNYRALVFQGYVVAAVLVFAVLAVLAHFAAYFPLDLMITRALQAFNPGWFDALMQAVTWVGRPAPQAGLLYGVPIIFLFVVGLRWESVAALFAAAGYAMSLLIKLVVNRPRPEAGLVRVFEVVRETSFPSGHVVTYTAFFGFLWFLCYVLLKHSWQRTLLLFLLGGMVILIGPSRIYLGEHWFSDVMGAYLLGSVWLALTIYVYRWGKPRFFVHQPVAPEQPQAAAR